MSPCRFHSAVHSPIAVSTSLMDAESKHRTRELVGQLGGQVLKDWKSKCTLLVMCHLKVSVKVNKMIGKVASGMSDIHMIQGLCQSFRYTVLNELQLYYLKFKFKY